MSDRPLEIIEPLALAIQGRTMEGRIDVARLARLLPLLRSSEGEAVYSLRFDRDEGGVPCVVGEVSATLVLQCQRCMEDMAYPVKAKVRLGIVTSRQTVEQLPDRYEPLLVSESDISVASIVEDELILALPIVAMHKTEECSSGEAYQQQVVTQEDNTCAKPQRENPFAVLAQLKDNLQDQGAAIRTEHEEE